MMNDNFEENYYDKECEMLDIKFIVKQGVNNN